MRDEEICEQYRAGMTQADLADKYNVTPARISQIVRKAGLLPPERPFPRSDRTKFIGLLLTKPMKEALRGEARQEGVSMTEFMIALISKELTQRGVDFKSIQQSTEEDVPLPYDSPDLDLLGKAR
jgi:transcriptional regulator with XRE-family HTH domain